MELGGNWTTNKVLMLTNFFSDLRLSGSWLPTSYTTNTTGQALFINYVMQGGKRLAPVLYFGNK